MTDRHCSVCCCQRNKTLFRQEFYAISSGSLTKGYSVVVCEDCGFCFAEGIPSQAKFDAYYANMSKYEHRERSGQESAYDRARFRHEVEIILPFLKGANSRILEIGCANGGFLAQLKQHGFTNLLGVDPSPSSASIARDLYDIPVVTANLSKMPFIDREFDVIILVGVLEHVRELGSALSTLHGLLAPKGQLYITVPDASRYTDGEDAPFQEFSVEHINFFGPKSLKNLMLTKHLEMLHCEQRLMPVGHRTSTPVIHAVFRKDSKALCCAVRDEETEKGLTSYIVESTQIDSEICRVLEALAISRQSIIVWGVGAHTLRLLATSRLKDANISVFVDSNPSYQGKMLNGVPIVAPHDLRDRDEAIVISSRSYQEEIASHICDDLKLENKLIRLYKLS